jgi:hypothetical protein
VLAELGIWAGAIGAAVHGAERAAGAGVAQPAATRTSVIADAEGPTAAATGTA